MNLFENFNLNTPLRNAIIDLGFDTPTPIQLASFSVILSGKDVVGIAQTGTGKTLAFMMPILHELKFSKQINPRVLILVPTRELVVQTVEKIEELTKYINLRILGVYGGTNINTQKQKVAEGTDILIGTPARLYDLAISGVLSFKSIQKLVIDEVDVMLDLGFRFQVNQIFTLIPERRQNIMYSATMTDEVEILINDYFLNPSKISIAVSGTPLENIAQSVYKVENFYTKVNLLKYLIQDKTEFNKVLVFVSHKKNADLVFEALQESFGDELCIIHSNKSQNYRMRSIEQFNSGFNRIIVATDVMARGLDLDNISHVINFDTPHFPENYMHRIGRTGRAKQMGKSILFYTEAEEVYKDQIENLMNYFVPVQDFPSEVAISKELTFEERPVIIESTNRTSKMKITGDAFHEKSEKNSKTNQGGSYKREIKHKFKKPLTRGDKKLNWKFNKK